MQGLASLFKAPAELLFHGSFEEAKAKAMEEGKWLVSTPNYLQSRSGLLAFSKSFSALS